MWALYLLIGILAGIVVAGILTMLIRALFWGRREQEPALATATEVAAASAAPIPVIVPAAAAEPVCETELFILSRQDVLDHVEAMQGNSERFPIAPGVKERETEHLPDYIKCGEICFSIIFERSDCVYNIAVRLDAETANSLGEKHPVEHASYLSGDDWYNLSVDQSYKSKREVYQILNASYDYVFRMSSELSEEEARAGQLVIEQEFAGNTEEVERVAAIAEENTLRALEQFKCEHYTDFRITRKEIVADTIALENPHITVLERVEPQMPVSLKYKGKSYAILYGTDKGVMMVVKLSDAFADKLAVKHPEIRRAKFPAGANWYYVPVDGAFESKEAVYTVLNASYGYVLVKYGSDAEVEASSKLIYTDFADRADKDQSDYNPDLTRKAIMEYTRGLENPDITIVDRPMEPQLPVSLKYQGKTYTMLYGTESGVVMIIKLSDTYIEKLTAKYSGVTKAKFPAGANWYSVPLNKTFANIEAVHSVLNNSIKFLEQYKAKKAKEAEQAQKAKAAKLAKAKTTKAKK